MSKNTEPAKDLSTKQAIIAAVAIIVLIAVVAISSRADEPKKPSELAQTKLELSQAKLRLSYSALQNAQNEFQKTLVEFNAQCAAVVKETGRPAGTVCDPETLNFIEPKKAEAKK